MTKEDKALLDMIAFCEGTLGVSNNGYDVVVGSKRLIAGWSEDTDITHGGSDWLDKTTNSTAAGRYQFLFSTWIGSKKINKPMTKANQNARALEIINSRLVGIDKTQLTTRAIFDKALNKLCTQWASIPVTSDITDSSGVLHKAGRSYYSSDGVNHSINADKIFDIYKKALALY